MQRKAYTLIELLVVIAIIAVLLGLLLVGVQKVRAVAARASCQNNLKQLALAAQNYHAAHAEFPPAATAPPGRANHIVVLLPFLDQNGVYLKFDMEKNVSFAGENAPARAQEVRGLLCPADPSTGKKTELIDGEMKPVGRNNYLGNLGTNAWWRNDDPKTVGIFHHADKPSPTRLGQVTDGASQTALYAEVRRGNVVSNAEDNVWVIPAGLWDSGLPQNDVTPTDDCNLSEESQDYRGLQYYRNLSWCSLYTHTVPVNYNGRDCVRGTGLDRAHIAARSYHSGGANVALCDGSVRLVPETIALKVWQAMGTRAGGDVAE
jgi:prepilin-type N-terminal cleavage/methylation domain-containing protein/prepilin-type processing-associated H-X9-DG protein